MPLKKAVLFFLLIYSSFAGAQELLPYVENFTKSEYNGDNQVWNVVQGKDNAMYFANHHYFLRYNGVKWEKYSLPNKTIIRSVFADGDRIYCGSYKEFGYWKRIAGKMEYFTISDDTLFTGNADNEEIWKIFKHGASIYFQSFNEIYRHDGNKTVKLKLPSQISYCYTVGDTIYAASVKNGIYVLKDDNFTRVKNWPQLNDIIIHGIEKSDGKLYFFTKNDGVYINNGTGLKEWESPLNNILKSDVILSAKFIDSNSLAIGTSLRGLYIISLKDGSYKNINRQNALKNNAVLSITIDKENDLWLGLDNGISHVEVNSPISLFTDNSGLLGSVYSLATIDSGYMFVTNHGIFSYTGNKPVAVPNSQGQVWDIYKNGNEFVIGHNDGTFIYNGSYLKKVNPVNGGWKFLKSNFDNAYFQANYSGIAVYKDINDLSKWKILDSIAKPIRNIAQNKAGELWAADNYRSLYRILYDKDFNVASVENVSRNIASDYGVKLFNFRGEILFLINNVWYVYNRLEDRLDKSIKFNKEFSNISDIIPVDDNNFMVIRNGLVYLISQQSGTFLWKLLSGKYYEGRLIMENTQSNKHDNTLLINLDDGFLAYKMDTDSKKKPKIKIEGFYLDKLIDDDTSIKYNQSVEIHIISEYYGYSRPDIFYRLNESSLTPVRDGSIILNNLSSGNQLLEIYYNNGSEQVKLGQYKFKVDKPWYFSFFMVVVYLIVIGGIFFLYYRWNKVRYIQKVRLNDEELKHRTQILRLEMEAADKLRQQEHEKHMLEVEVQTKASEVAGKSLSIAKHSEMIENIQVVLQEESNVEQLKSKIKKVIKSSTISKNEWQSFEKNLMKSHEEFVSRLTTAYPSLTSKDIKLCIYLKMNLSSKEIAPLMGISYRGIELHRYRLRKKLDISTDESLSGFMISL